MTTRLLVRTNDVTGFCPLTYQKLGVTTHCGYLFAARHELQLLLKDEDFQPLGQTDGGALLVRVSLDARACQLKLSAPDFSDGVSWPYERPVQSKTVTVQVSGDAVLRRIGAGSAQYEVVVGVLRCAFAPMFEAWQDAPRASALTAFWPSLPRTGQGLDYWFTPLGLALEGVLDLRATNARDVLLLPRHQADAASDAAWRAISDSERTGTHAWNRLDTPVPAPAKPNLPALVDGLRADAPNAQAWPGTEPRWAMLRWRLMTPDRQPFIDHCFQHAAAGVRLERASSSDLASPECAELVCQLWVTVGGARPQLEHGGMVCDVSGGVMTAQFVWDARERNSLMTARVARSALWVSGELPGQAAALFDLVRITLRTSSRADPPAPNLFLKWEHQHASQEQEKLNVQMGLAATGMLCGGTISGDAGIDPPAMDPRLVGGAPAADPPVWLMLEDGCLQLGPTALPLDGRDERPAQALLAAVANSSQAFRGGLPLETLGGPDGLSAWVSADANGSEPQVVLRIDRFDVQLSLYDAILVWRTPGWWACAGGQRQAGLELPPLGRPFVKNFAAVSASRSEADAKLARSLAEVLFPAIWVGRAGLVVPGGWSLDMPQGGPPAFVVPAPAVQSSVLWTAFRDAYLVQTIPAGGQALGGPLLDPARALVPLTHGAGEPLKLLIGESRLPRLASARFPVPTELASGWSSYAMELFHPNITGLTLELGDLRYRYRHGPPLLADGYLRARLDGTLGTTPVTGSLSSVRPADDVGIEAIDVKLPMNTSYTLRGWLAAPQTVTVSELALQLGGADPHMSMEAVGGVTKAEMLSLRIGSRTDGFALPVHVATDSTGTSTYLTRDVAVGKPFHNFGQSLWVDDASLRFRDGSGRRWELFDGGARQVTSISEGPPEVRHKLTHSRAGVVDGGAVGGVELVLCLVDLDPIAPESGGSWDLSGPLRQGAASPPTWGPFVLLGDALACITTVEATVRARLALPEGGPGLPPTEAGGAVLLRWQSHGKGWRLELDANSCFTWRVQPPQGTQPSVAGISGMLVLIGTHTALRVDRVSLYSLLGEVDLPCSPVELEYVFEDGTCVAFSVPIEILADSGLEAKFVLRYRFQAGSQPVGWSIEPSRGHPLELRWHCGQSTDLVLDLAAGSVGAIRFIDAGARTWQLQLAQAGMQRWLAVGHTSDGLEFAGCLETHSGTTGQSTQLRLSYSWTQSLLEKEAENLFGPLAQGSRLRINGTADASSLHWTGARQSMVRALSGQLALLNDYEFEFSQPGSRPEILRDHVHCFFDAAPLDEEGHVADRVLFAMVEHRFHDGSAIQPRFVFQLPQAVRLTRASDRATGLTASSVILVQLGAPKTDKPHIVPQILYAPDAALGACRGSAHAGAQIQGALLRVPLRTGQGRAVQKVPLSQSTPLVWFPLVRPPSGVGTTPSQQWQERRSLSSALDVLAISELCESQPAAVFSSDASLPTDGDTLQEWSVLAQAAGWLHSGLFAPDVGVLSVPYYAGAEDAAVDAAAGGAISATLFVPDGAVPGGLRRVAEALVASVAEPGEADAAVAGADRAALRNWSHRELLRRSLRTSALVMAHGRPSLSAYVPRSFEVAAVDDEMVAPALQPRVAHARHSAWVELMRPMEEASSSPPQLLSARVDEDAVVEVVDAQPLAVDGEPALRFRLALNHLVSATRTAVPVGLSGAALSKRQRAMFAVSNPPDAPLHGTLPLVSPLAAQSAQIVSPIQIDVRTAIVRPGDTVHTHWSLRTGVTQVGPGVELGLRAPRASNLVTRQTAALQLTETASARVDGVDWLLRDVTTARSLGPVAQPMASPGVEVTVVTPRETVHRLLTLAGDPSAQRALALGVAAREVGDLGSAEESREVSLRLLEPLLCGAFPHEIGAELGEGAELAWAIAAGDEGREAQGSLDPSTVSTPAEIDASVQTRATWNAGHNIRVVQLGPWQPVADQPGHADASIRPEGYSLVPGNDLARLLQLTHKERNSPRHWLLKESLTAGPLLVVLIRAGGALRYLVAAAVDWRRGAALDQPERVLAVRDGQVLGFGDLSGPVGLRLEAGKFMLYNTAYALDWKVSAAGAAAAASAWVFGATGACVGIATAST